jgi:hypothetical protein
MGCAVLNRSFPVLDWAGSLQGRSRQRVLCFRLFLTLKPHADVGSEFITMML